MKVEWWEYLVAAIVGVTIFTIIVGWISSVNERGRARDCDLMGVTMLNGKPYKCSRIVPEAGQEVGDE